MRTVLLATICLAGGLLATLPFGSLGASERAQNVDEDGLSGFPDDSGLPLPPGLHAFPPFPGARKPGVNPGVNAPLVPPAAKAPDAPPRPAQTRAEMLDSLFQRLAAAADQEEASGVAKGIQRLWLQSGSDTADFLMSRAASVMASGKADLAGQLLDRIVALDPAWVEGWNRRATMRFLRHDDFGSMEDITHVLSLEPRHFGALSGMAMILQRHGMKKEALATLRKAAEIYPHNSDVETMIETLTPDVEGRPL